MTTRDDSYEAGIAAEAFFRDRLETHPDWTEGDSFSSLRKVHRGIADLVRRHPDVLGELRVALLIAGLLDEGWHQIRALSQGRTWPSEEPVEVDRLDEPGLHEAIERSLDTGIAWMLDELVAPVRLSRAAMARRRDAPSSKLVGSIPFLAFRHPVHHADLQHDIPGALIEVGFREPTKCLVAAAMWAAMLGNMIDRRHHPSTALLVAFQVAFSDVRPPAGMLHYRTSRLHPGVSAPHGVGRTPLRRTEWAARVREERALALEVLLFWRKHQRTGVTAPQQTALRVVAERCGEHIARVKNAWYKHRPLIKLWEDLLEQEPVHEAPSVREHLLLELYDDLSRGASDRPAHEL